MPISALRSIGSTDPRLRDHLRGKVHAVETFRPALPVGLGIAAGAMIWMVVAELIPDALEVGERMPIAATVTMSVAAMTAFQAAFSGI